MVFYRKYRPQTIGELDSSKVRETLYAVFSRPDIPHAFLLTGPKGLGKTSTARIIAKVVNCEHTDKGKASSASLPVGKAKGKEKTPNASPLTLHPSIEPDNTCEQCVSITNGSNLDVLEIDGASNRGIDEIRDLREKVKLAPSHAKKKVYIIDEVHMLTTEAFNALLKTIEEPPSHVMFIFCTTESHKVPETILSRCFYVPYLLASEEDLVRSLKRIVEGEKIDITDEALHMIAKLSDGGFRDGAKVLEELVTVSEGKKITKDLIEQKFQVSNIQYQIAHMLQTLIKKDVKESLQIISNVVQQGIDMKYFIGQILEILHNELLNQVGILSSTINHKPLALSIGDIQALVGLFSKAYQETKYAVISQLPLELAIITWCTTDNQVLSVTVPTRSSGGSEAKQSSLGEKPTTLIAPISPKSQTSHHSMDSLLKKEKNLKAQEILRPKDDKPLAEKGLAADGSVEKKGKTSSQEELTDKSVSEQLMANLIYKIKPVNFSVAGVLRGCAVKNLGQEEVTFQTMYAFHKEKLDDPKIRELLEKAIKEITGKSLKVVVELKGTN